jgi:probable F420-dependent oxidoreductase
MSNETVRPRGRIGAWTSGIDWPKAPDEIATTAAAIEAMGYGTLWIGGATASLDLHERVLAATSSIVVATAIVDVWSHAPEEVAASNARVVDQFPGRFILGLGAGHAPLVEAATGQTWAKPIGKLRGYLDVLDAAPRPVPPGQRVLAALGPVALRLAAERTGGAHPYLVPPEHTAAAREVLGAGPLLAPEQKVFVGTDPSEARAVGRHKLALYLTLPNYLNNLRRYGLDDDDFAGTGSDRLVDTTVAWGSDQAISSRIQAHFDAGADHVAVHALSTDPTRHVPLPELRAAAEVLLGEQ